MTAPGSDTAIGRASVWLDAYLASRGGQAGAGALLIAGVASGHAPRTLRRAGAALGVVMARRGQGNTWTMPAPAEPVRRRGKRGQSAAKDTDHSGQAPDVAATDAEPAPPRLVRVPTSIDVFGRPTEFVQVVCHER